MNIILDKMYGGNLEGQVVKKCHDFESGKKRLQAIKHYRI